MYKNWITFFQKRTTDCRSLKLLNFMIKNELFKSFEIGTF